jgi:4-amino-4-deoxy-L-arabinose transferase-like glycosyltransferase
LLAALPLLMMHPKLDTSGDIWAAGTAGQSLFGFIFLYSNDADRLLYWGRVPMIMLAALGAVFTFLWARDLFGPSAGILAAGLYSFSPNLLAHGMLVTSDVPVATFIMMTLYLFWKGFEKPLWYVHLATGLALGAAMTTKFSAALLPIILIVISFARFGRSAIERLIVMAIGSLVVIEVSYLFTASPLLYFRNLIGVNAYVIQNYPIYLFGQTRRLVVLLPRRICGESDCPNAHPHYPRRYSRGNVGADQPLGRNDSAREYRSTGGCDFGRGGSNRNPISAAHLSADLHLGEPDRPGFSRDAGG